MIHLIALITLALAPGYIEPVIYKRAKAVHAKASGSQLHRMAVAVAKYSKEYQVPPEVVIAVIEHESTFSPIVISSRNCVGLMQLSPPTAKAVAADLGMVYYNLQNVEHNIRIGTKYLSDLYVKYKNWNRVLSAYNMGPTKLKSLGVKKTLYSDTVRRKMKLQRGNK